MEVTISLSNHPHPSGKRVIGIKPFFQQQESEAPSQVDDKQDRELEVKQLEEEANDKLRHAESKLAEVKQETERMVQQAQEEVEQQKGKWEQEKQQLIEETKQAAYKDGHEQGKNDAFREYEQLIEEAKKIVETANHDYHAKVEQSEETILNLGIKIAEKVISKKLDDDPSAFMSIVHSVIHEVKELEQLALYVHPDQYPNVINQKSELEMIVDYQANLSIYPKNGLKQNQCYVESSFGRVDASVDSQLEELRAKLFSLLREA